MRFVSFALSRFIVSVLLAGLIFINLPSAIPIKITFGSVRIDRVLEPKLDVQLPFGGPRVTREFTTKLGLDLQGGSHFVFEADTSKLKEEDVQDALEATRNIIERRVNQFGVSEPVIQTVRSGVVGRISVDLPGISQPQEAVSLIGQTAKLTFKEEGALDPSVPESIATLSAIFKLTKETGLTGSDVRKAQLGFSQQNGEPVIEVAFNDKGKAKFAEITKRNVGKQIGIFLDNSPLMAPVVQTEIIDGNAIITGGFTVEDAKRYAIAINSGALPLSVKLVEQRTVGPSLGAQEVNQSIFAGAIGLVMVVIFMVVYYGRLGVVAVIGLVLYGLISHALFRLIPVVLTLPGIAGFILSIGMAVDANILIFERIKEELRAGKPQDVAIRLGFGHAMDAIKDANITTLLVAFILFNPLNWSFLPQFGLVRGFALTLAIGVVTSLFTGIVVTRRLLKIFYK
jgi:preprotein translocase subunit SecD